MRKIFTLIIISILIISSAEAQRRGRSSEFDLSLRAGINMCQIDGDKSGNYSQPGFHAGVNTSFPLGDSDEWRFLVEIGLSNKGSHVKQIDRHISLLYVEVPLMLTYNALDDRLRIGGGVAPAILAMSNVTDDGIRNVEQSANYKRFDMLPLVLGVRYKVGGHIALGIRYYNSMLNIAKQNGSGTYRIFRSNKGQFSRLVQAGVEICF